MTDEIKNVALRHLATDGMALSLRAVARDMGMVSSALYRYFASRDDLLTALILDAYNALGEVAEQADAAEERSDLLGRWMSVGHAIRDWAVAKPHEYALIYGTPLPGYAAPQATVEPASRPVLVMARILADASAAQAPQGTDAALTPADGAGMGPHGLVEAGLNAEIEQISALIGAGVGTHAMARGLLAWTELFGAINFEVFGRLDNVISERAAWFDWQLRSMAAYMGLDRVRA